MTFRPSRRLVRRNVFRSDEVTSLQPCRNGPGAKREKPCIFPRTNQMPVAQCARPADVGCASQFAWAPSVDEHHCSMSRVEAMLPPASAEGQEKSTCAHHVLTKMQHTHHGGAGSPRPVRMTLGERLKLVRGTSSQKAFAAELSIHENTVSNAERRNSATQDTCSSSPRPQHQPALAPDLTVRCAWGRPTSLLAEKIGLALADACARPIAPVMRALLETRARAMRAGANYLRAIGVTERTLPDTEALAKLRADHRRHAPDQLIREPNLCPACSELMRIQRTGPRCALVARRAQPVTVIEYYDRALDHYFITSLQPDIEALDSGHFLAGRAPGLPFRPSRTRQAAARASTRYAGSTFRPLPIRIFSPPRLRNVRRFSRRFRPTRITVALSTKHRTRSTSRRPTPPRATAGRNRTGLSAVDQRADTNHRYTADPATKALMLAKGYVTEGYGPTGVVMCTVGAAKGDTTVRVSALSPLALGCDGAPCRPAPFIVAPKLKPMVSLDRLSSNHLIGVWQQDRWSDGGARRAN